MYLNDLTTDYDGFLRLDSPPRDIPMSGRGKNLNGIAPWGNGEKILGSIRPLSNFNKEIQNIQQNLRVFQQQHGQSHNFIQSPQKGKKNRSNLGKLQKSIKNNKINQFHLNMSKIQFKQYEQNSLLQNQNQKLFKTNPKINIKDFSSLDNNFFIKSYFFPNSLKSTNRKDDPQSLDNKKRKQYFKIKEIQVPTFLAIKSVDLKQKFQLEEYDSDEIKDYPLEGEKNYSRYRTISVLSSRKKSPRKVNKSMNENYQLQNSDKQFKIYNKTIQSTKQSSKQINDSLRQRYKIVIQQKAKKDKLSQSNDKFFTNSSSIKINLDENFHSEETKITEEKEQFLPKAKKVTLSKERQTRIDQLKRLKSRSDHENIIQNLTYYLEPKTIPQFKNQRKSQNGQSYDSNNYKNGSQSFRNRIQSTKNHKNQLMIYDQQFLGNKTGLNTINNSIFSLKDKNQKSFRMK